MPERLSELGAVVMVATDEEGNAGVRRAARPPARARDGRVPPDVLGSAAEQIANRWPCVGLAVGVIRDGRLDRFQAHGHADIATRSPVTEDTRFRVASITKTFTAIAVMQLWERGEIDLDAPANSYLRAYRLVPARPGLGQPTVRHLLTHTAGIREVLHPSGLLRPRDLGETVEAGRPVPTLGEFYRGALRFDAEPGTVFTYTNHGFATLGQIVEDVSGRSLDDVFREDIFAPLGMADSGLGRPPAAAGTAAAYELRAGRAEPLLDYDVVAVAAGGVYSTTGDMARYVAALLGGGRNEHGVILKPETLASMFAPQFQPDPRLPGIGLAFFRSDLGGHIAVEHDGILPGFDSQMILAPDDGVGVIAFANGAKRGMHWLVPETQALVRQVLDVPADAIRTDVPHHPEVWGELTGRYRFSALASDPARLLLGPVAQVSARRGRLILRPLSPIPSILRGFVLHPDDPDDPYVFRIEVPWFGLGTARVAFAVEPGASARAIYTDFAPIGFVRRDRTVDRAGAAPVRRPIERLSALDRVMLGASRRWPQEISALAYLDGRGLVEPDGSFRIDVARGAIASKLHLVPRLRQVVRVPPRKLGGPVWVDADRFDLNDHVRAVALPHDSGETELLAAVEALRRQPLDPALPLWGMWFLTGLTGDRVALFVKVHHVIADGTAVMRMITSLLDEHPDVPVHDGSDRPPAAAPTRRELWADERSRRARRRHRAVSSAIHPWARLRRLHAAWPSTRELLAERPSPKTSLDRMIGLDRTLAVLRTDLDEVVEVARTHSATVNDVLLTGVAAGLGALLRGRGESVDALRVYVPIALRRPSGGSQLGNRIAQMAIPLPVGIVDPERLLERVAAESARRKARPRAALGALFGGRFLRRLTLMAAMRQRVNVTTADIRGPEAPLHLAGARMLEVFPVLPLIANESIGVGGISYAGGFDLGIVVDRGAVPDLAVFVAGMREALEQLGISIRPAPIARTGGAHGQRAAGR